MCTGQYHIDVSVLSAGQTMEWRLPKKYYFWTTTTTHTGTYLKIQSDQLPTYKMVCNKVTENQKGQG